MSFVNYASREINCKVVYYGPGHGGTKIADRTSSVTR